MLPRAAGALYGDDVFDTDVVLFWLAMTAVCLLVCFVGAVWLVLLLLERW